MHMKLLDPQSLSRGTERQKNAFRVLQSLGIFTELAAHSPVVAGAIPLDLDVPGSDLDVVCSTENLEEFASQVTQLYGSQPEFKIEHVVVDGLPTVVARLRSEDFPIEIFAQNRSVFQQPAVIHMLVEARLLAFAAQGARERIRALKATGIKTEPAFADAFGLQGDPYQELLKIATLPDREILHIAHRFLFRPQ